MKDIQYQTESKGQRTRLEGAMRVFLENYDIHPDVPVVVSEPRRTIQIFIRPRTELSTENVFSKIRDRPLGLSLQSSRKYTSIKIGEWSYFVFYDSEPEAEGGRK